MEEQGESIKGNLFRIFILGLMILWLQISNHNQIWISNILVKLKVCSVFWNIILNCGSCAIWNKFNIHNIITQYSVVRTLGNGGYFISLSLTCLSLCHLWPLSVFLLVCPSSFKKRCEVISIYKKASMPLNVNWGLPVLY